MLSVVFWLASVFTCCEMSKRPSLQSFPFLQVCPVMLWVYPKSVEQVEHKEVMAAFATLFTTAMDTRNNKEADCNRADEASAGAEIPRRQYRPLPSLPPTHSAAIWPEQPARCRSAAPLIQCFHCISHTSQLCCDVRMTWPSDTLTQESCNSLLGADRPPRSSSDSTASPTPASFALM